VGAGQPAGWTTGGWSICAGCSGALGGNEADVDARCLMALSLWIGNHFLAADHEGRSRAEVLERAARLLEA